MGLIKALTGSVIGTVLDTWKDYFVCDSLDNDTLMVKGTKRGFGGSGDVITNGSGIIVNEGQCALIIEEGNILEVANEPGSYTFDSSLSPSIFDGGLEGLKNSFKDAVERFTFGGEVNKSQRVYYVNTKEIMENRFGTATPIPFRVIFDKTTGSEVEISVKCNGEFTFRIVNPVVFYQKVAGNKADRFEKDELISIMKSEMMDALNPAFGKLSDLNIRYSELPSHTTEIKDALREALRTRWEENRGIALDSLTINSVTIPEADAEKIKNIQFSFINRDKDTANATIVSATADAIRDAANNANGAATGFMNVNMATNTGAQFLQQNNTAQGGGGFCPFCGQPVPSGAKFCPSCGKALQ
ncbi:MAG: SPFH domain-containing protein [Erysipelotrichaceae bacterium]|jgi:membrane protease subunit (stomatin/prohibitin family)|nr:SPFH domain-containing protein [Erysipelotrichaceae bacterium]MBQ1379804.1 SPFH domain-containing protein [Erysipelotrichaceae bacterium]MBQ1624485.1 SPFH domain-containing protein [Erysipelotrichaceae bacterium]MBQ1910511.1 SPFH domain-containing protein [Erysipelotrichaceae bacterium]MBQ2078394.1 SPFH domain-containing protein [Erysipelotrichaceae bacterium]